MTTPSATLAESPQANPASAALPRTQGFLLPIVGGAALAHLLNDLIQAMLPAIFPLLKTGGFKSEVQH
ncbi:hypothetical protein N5C15_21100, partial [Comamonas terrigena]|nr:hypothetical protein [Comamonas terrigena]